MASLQFDATGVEPQAPMTLLPRGTYTARVTGSEMKEAASGNGSYLELEMTIIDGPFANRKLWDRLNLVNSNKTAEDIARKQLSALCHAVGVLKVADSAELHDKPFAVEVGIEKGKDGYDDKNRIRGYMAAGGALAPAANTPFAGKPAAVAPKSNPWGIKRA